VRVTRTGLGQCSNEAPLATSTPMPYPIYGERVVAFVVLRDVSPSPADIVAELLEHCRARLARFKVPAQINVLHDMPKNAVGKIAKQQLRDKLTSG
jgi:long-chain acyl-CoA synthetase